METVLEAVKARTKLLLPPATAPKSKGSLRDHLEAVEKQTGHRDERLDEPEMPCGWEPTWNAFWLMYSGQVLTFAEIDAWSRLTGEVLTPHEAEMLRKMSVVAFKEAHDG